MQGTKVAQLWQRTTSDGKAYLIGPMTRVTQLVIVENEKKQGPRDPDFLAYIVPNRSGKTKR